MSDKLEERKEIYGTGVKMDSTTALWLVNYAIALLTLGYILGQGSK